MNHGTDAQKFFCPQFKDIEYITEKMLQPNENPQSYIFNVERANEQHNRCD